MWAPAGGARAPDLPLTPVVDWKNDVSLVGYIGPISTGLCGGSSNVKYWSLGGFTSESGCNELPRNEAVRGVLESWLCPRQFWARRMMPHDFS